LMLLPDFSRTVYRFFAASERVHLAQAAVFTSVWTCSNQQ
jgi:hypothetical protein